MIQFGRPLFLICLIAVPLLAAMLIWGVWRRHLGEARFGGAGLLFLRSGGRSSPWRRRVKAGLLLGVVALLAISITRPQVGQQHVLLPRQGSDLVIAMDVSRSMDVTDVKPSRLDQAKQSAIAILNHLGGDRVGLVAFAGSAELRFPITTDFEAARQVILGLALKDGGLKAGTDIGAALREASSVFTGDKTRGKTIVLISDGEDLAQNDVAAAQAAAAAGITVDTVGVGTAAGGVVMAADPRTNQPAPEIDPTTGKPAVSHRNDDNLRQLAAAGHGVAYDGNTTDFAFDLSAAIDSGQKTVFTTGVATVPIERFQIPLGVALALLLLDSLIAEHARRRAAVSGSAAGAETSLQPASPVRGRRIS